ncbi:MAG: DNA replication protein [Vezdaea acicularis]|nr:MAG: DNA replication protein [Vezdaea acicularis]
MGSYYDIDSILTDAQVHTGNIPWRAIVNIEQKVPCTFELDVPDLGYLDGNAGGDLKQGTRVDVPLWLGVMLAIGYQLGTPSLVRLDLPNALSQRVLNALKADPRTVDLRSQASHFYSLGARMLELFEEEEIADVLIETFKIRAAEIADHAHNPRGALGEGADFLRGLDETERQLFRSAHESAKLMRSWMGDMKKK